MGYRVSWIARSGSSINEMLTLSQRSLTDERHDFPDVGFYLLELSSATENSWVVLIADGSENFSKLDASHAKSLSEDDNEILYFWCSDTVMATELSCFRDGKRIWSIIYDCDDKSKRPEMLGEVPTITHEVMKELQIKQEVDNDADYIYDLTAELGRRLIGFRHDVDIETDDPEPFQVLSN